MLVLVLCKRVPSFLGERVQELVFFVDPFFKESLRDRKIVRQSLLSVFCEVGLYSFFPACGNRIEGV